MLSTPLASWASSPPDWLRMRWDRSPSPSLRVASRISRAGSMMLLRAKRYAPMRLMRPARAKPAMLRRALCSAGRRASVTGMPTRTKSSRPGCPASGL